MSIVGDLIEFSPATTIVSNDVDANFAALKAAINTAVFTDETRTMTAAQRLANNVALVGRNAANAADLTMWKINSSDFLQTTTELRTAQGAPTADNTSSWGVTSLRWAYIYAHKLVLTTQTPASASDTGVQGQLAWDASYIYVCVGTNTWERVAIASW